jgi:hypothetical protein
MPRKRQRNAKKMRRKCQETIRNTRECNNKQHKHPVPAQEEEGLEYMESFENDVTYIGMLRKLTTILSKCQEHAQEMPRKCQGNNTKMLRRCQGNAKNYMEMQQ